MKIFGSIGLENTTILILGKSCGAGLANIGLAGAGISVIHVFKRGMKLGQIRNTANAAVKNSKYSISRSKKTWNSNNDDDNYKTNPYYNDFPQIEVKNKSACTAFSQDDNVNVVSQHLPGIYGKPHPYNIQIPQCRNDPCGKKFPCINPYCDILKVKASSYSTHCSKEPVDTSGEKVYTHGLSAIIRKERQFIGNDLNDKPEYVVPLNGHIEIDPRSLILSKISSINKNPERGAKILDLIEYTSKND